MFWTSEFSDHTVTAARNAARLYFLPLLALRSMLFPSEERAVRPVMASFKETQTLEKQLEPDEFGLTLPVGQDNELVATQAAEQIARRLDFKPEGINQIKRAVAEACINAARHSLKHDEFKIYLRFRVETDKLVITISTRAFVPSKLMIDTASQTQIAENELAKERRGWGLKLIRSHMDEVEVELADDGTKLRMTKYRD